MQKTYKEALFDANIYLEELIKDVEIPQKLYKFQGFYSPAGIENEFWKRNIQGEFHFSLASEFEDKADCNPDIDGKKVLEQLRNSLQLISQNCKKEKIDEIISELENSMGNNINTIKKNFQNNIRIGCFTDDFQNEEMWRKYADDFRGFCIEYDTDKEELFSNSMLPILYTQDTFDISIPYIDAILLACFPGKDDEDKIDKFEVYYKKILKMTYAPVFIKETKWEFEKEYRMFLLNNMNTKDGLIKMQNKLDDNYNINLSNAIKTIYLGKNFRDNENADQIYNTILTISNKKKFNIVLL